MDDAREWAKDVATVPKLGKGRPQLVHSLSGRFRPAPPKLFLTVVKRLAVAVDPGEFDYVLGFPEGGSLPAFVFAQVVDRPVLLSTRLAVDLPGVVTFEEPHSVIQTTHNIYGLRAGDRVVIVEDEITTGQTVLNAVRALRAASIRVDHVCALFTADDPAVRRRIVEAGLHLHAAVFVPGVVTPSGGE